MMNGFARKWDVNFSSLSLSSLWSSPFSELYQEVFNAGCLALKVVAVQLSAGGVKKGKLSKMMIMLCPSAPCLLLSALYTLKLIPLQQQ